MGFQCWDTVLKLYLLSCFCSRFCFIKRSKMKGMPLLSYCWKLQSFFLEAIGPGVMYFSRKEIVYCTFQFIYIYIWVCQKHWQQPLQYITYRDQRVQSESVQWCYFVCRCDQAASNGVVHTVDSLLLPRSEREKIKLWNNVISCVAGTSITRKPHHSGTSEALGFTVK